MEVNGQRHGLVDGAVVRFQVGAAAVDVRLRNNRLEIASEQAPILMQVTEASIAVALPDEADVAGNSTATANGLPTPERKATRGHPRTRPNAESQPGPDPATIAHYADVALRVLQEIDPNRQLPTKLDLVPNAEVDRQFEQIQVRDFGYVRAPAAMVRAEMARLVADRNASATTETARSRRRDKR